MDQISESAVKSLQQSIDHQTAVNAEPSAFLEHAPSDTQLLLSPLVDFDSGKARGVLAQLLSSPLGEAPSLTEDMKAPKLDGVDAPLEPRDRSASPVGKLSNFTDLPVQDRDGNASVDGLPLDEHPFFRRIAEILPTGLAILNYKADAVFVNQQFYELTTHMKDNRSFSTWPHTIHPDDFERVMAAYQKAVETQMPLRMEFRSQGEGDPWRLLLLSPLGDERTGHASLHNQGGFLCAVIDITSTKAAELAQQKAAREAQERKDQQERFIDMISHEISKRDSMRFQLDIR